MVIRLFKIKLFAVLVSVPAHAILNNTNHSRNPNPAPLHHPGQQIAPALFMVHLNHTTVESPKLDEYGIRKRPSRSGLGVHIIHRYRGGRTNPVLMKNNLHGYVSTGYTNSQLSLIRRIFTCTLNSRIPLNPARRDSYLRNLSLTMEKRGPRMLLLSVA